jgi:Mor family transcriptional regulator
MVQELFDFSLSLSPDDFPGKIRTVALRIGVKEAALLMDKVAGLEIYIPTAGKDLLNHQYIKENYNGFNALSLGIKLRMNSTKVKALADKPCASIESIYSAQLKIVAKECGNDIAKKLLIEFPGERIMVPSDYNFLKRLFVRKHFHGNNTYDLAVKLRVSDRFIRKIVSEMYEDQNNLQLSLFK